MRAIVGAPLASIAPLPAPRVSVVVPARDALPGLIGVLDALAAQTLPRGDFEVLLVDDGSRDATAEVAAEHPLAPRVLHRARPGGSYAARNHGLAVAAGEAIAFTDVDCRPEPEWLENALARLALDGRQLVAGHVEVPLRERPSLAEAIDVARFLDQERGVAAGFAATANLVVPAAAFTAAGTFDERLRSGGDLEWCSRAVAAGYRLVYAPDVRVVHPPRTRARGLARKALRVGVGAGQMRAHGVGPWATRRPLWAAPGAWRMPRELQGESRLRAAGPGGARHGRRALLAGQYLLVHLPMLVGSAAGQLRARSGPR